MNRVGRYRLGCRWIEVCISSEVPGGYFELTPNDGISQIVLGTDRSQADFMAVLVHEATEIAMTDLGLRFEPTPDYAGSTDSFMFMMTHREFSEAAARVGWFLTLAWPDLFKAWSKCQPNSSSKKTRTSKSRTPARKKRL